ncbi:MAG: acireductone synthase [Acidobacteriaceae bacterium]|nr:acireductone synthase [Acidobacteriaceae bacterium]
MPRLYLLDIEGTTSPISFVYNVLFPYARERMTDYVVRNADIPEVQAALRQLAHENAIDRSKGAPVIYYPQPLSQDPSETLKASTAYLLWLMGQDRKSTALKSIQGRIWAEGYERGDLHSEVFSDVPAALERWHTDANVGIYSSGSVEAQKYLFRYTQAGDLTRFIDAYFDTQTGAKVESASYGKIADALKVSPADVLFISDAVRELDAARDAGMRTLLSLRPGNSPVEDDHGHSAIRSFDEV